MNEPDGSIPNSATKRPLDARDGARPRVHFLGVCGKGMGAIATALVAEGWPVTGSDEAAYPPMDAFLAASGIVVRSPYQAANLPDDVELVIVGKRVRAENPELRRVMAQGIPYASFPAFLRDAFLARSKNAIVAGGVGKTTTTAMLAWVLQCAELRPDYLIGGLARNFTVPARLAGSGVAVIEGDEYASCFDDAAPKFLKYPPGALIVTNILEDHPDLYPDADAVERAFAALVRRLPKDGCLVLPDDDPAAQGLARAAPCRPTLVGFAGHADLHIAEMEQTPAGSEFLVNDVRFRIPSSGRMNMRNAAMAAAAAGYFDVSLVRSAEALRDFKGVAGRQDMRHKRDLTIVVDKATHPVALRAMLEAVRQSRPNRRLVSVLCPRATGGKSWIYQRDLPAALDGVGVVVLLDSYEHNPEPGRTWPAGAFSIDLLAASIERRGIEVIRVAAPDAISDALRRCLRTNDVIVVSIPEQATTLLSGIDQAVDGWAADGNGSQEAE